MLSKKYSKKTMTALKKSIKHWQENYQAESLDDINIFCDTCPLCMLFAIDATCEGCPVSDYTGQQDCEGSPWPKVRHWYDEDYIRYEYDYPNSADDKPSARLKAAIKKELDFLIKLESKLRG